MLYYNINIYIFTRLFIKLQMIYIIVVKTINLDFSLVL